ncbi:hypothetical protein E2C01_045145 [Portunus trituberculatus]|uniref:Uncharacterized protein n=1 Tax=Portunus trituberculatus TaxID=210409 RepID=A0A5B7FU55_PORTR|nr:hypothetical protein [Portunus trituberculatus]
MAQEAPISASPRHVEAGEEGAEACAPHLTHHDNTNLPPIVLLPIVSRAHHGTSRGCCAAKLLAACPPSVKPHVKGVYAAATVVWRQVKGAGDGEAPLAGISRAAAGARAASLARPIVEGTIE